MDRRTFTGHMIGGTFLLAGCEGGPIQAPPSWKRLLVLTQTAGFRHASIPAAVAALQSLGEESQQWRITGQADSADEVTRSVTAEQLRQVDGIVFASTTGSLSFTPDGRTAFYQWIRDGGAFIGLHSASDTFHGDAEFLALVGGEFLTHGPETQVDLVVQDPDHPACRGLPASFAFHDEIYEFQHWRRSETHVLLAMRRHPQTGTPGDFPVSWTKRYGAGRMFYTALGHRDDAYVNPLFRQHLTGGILWALGLRPGDDTPGNPVR